MMELVEDVTFKTERAFREGMDEIRHFNPPCEYEYKLGYTQIVFPRPGKRLLHNVKIYWLGKIDKTRCSGCCCDFFNHGDCERPEEYYREEERRGER